MPGLPLIWSDGAWRTWTGGTVTPPTDPDPEPLPPLFPGHIPNRVIIGMNAPDDTGSPTAAPRPKYTEQYSMIPGGMGYARRMFSSNWWSRSKMNSMINACEEHDQLPVVSFKVGNDWNGVANGNYDDDLLDLVDYARDKRVVNGGNGNPFLISIHHEPNSDGPSGMTILQQLTWWGRMHEHLLDVLHGDAGGNSEDVTDIAVVAPIANGFWWGSKASHPDRIAAALPPSLIAKMNAFGGPIMSDCYDPAPNTWSRVGGHRNEASFTFNSNYDRCWRNMQGMVNWARANNVKSIGFGEFGNVTLTNWDLTTDVLMDNRDLISVALMYNNFVNSRWDWRAVPNGYPSYNPVNSKGLTDAGGDNLSAAYITKFVNLRDRSVAETDPF